ncbi:MAG: AmmeMemoRadiSam system radical SAM enzyme [Halanaerobiaceae bacterium]
MKKAEYYIRENGEKVKCRLCPHGCIIKTGNRGVCRARVNKDGKLYTENYAMLSSIGEDPVEKKPLYHFYPGSRILSVGTFGCNFTCDYCQNWEISQKKPSLQEISPEELLDIVSSSGSIGIAYTYSEPMIWFEYVRDTAKLARKKGLKNVLVTNGFINSEPLKELLPLIDAANVDLKSIDNKFYRELCGGQLEPVQQNIKTIYNSGIHLELTTLIITDYNDTVDEMNKLFSRVADLDRDIPLHLSRYFPHYRLKKPRTSINKMKEAYRLAKEKLNYVYVGNVMIDGAANTYCPQCGAAVIKRRYYNINNLLVEGCCPECGQKINGRF